MPALRGGERIPLAVPSLPWRGIGASGLLHIIVAAALIWWQPSPQPATPSVAAEIVFWPGPDAGAEAPSGDLLARQEEAQPAEPAAAPEPPLATEAAPEPVPAPEETAEPVVSVEPEAIKPVEQPAARETVVEPVAETAVAPPPEPMLPAFEQHQPEAAIPPPPAESPQEVTPTTAPAAPKPVEIARALPPPPRPRPVPVRSSPTESSPPIVNEAAPQPVEAVAQPPAAAVASPVPATSAAVAALPSQPPEVAETPVIHEPRYRHPPAPPRYPPRALDLNQQGTVVVRALVAPDGSSGEIIVWRSSGFALLDAAALRAVRNWAFEPASIGGRRIASWVEVPVRFAIR